MKLWTLARKRWIVRWNLQTCSLPEGISCFKVSFSYRVGLDEFAFLKYSISICEGRTRTEQDTGKYYKKGKMYQKLKIKDLYFHFVLWYITKKTYIYNFWKAARYLLAIIVFVFFFTDFYIEIPTILVQVYMTKRMLWRQSTWIDKSIVV